MDFDGARRSSLFLGEIGVDLKEWRIDRRANVRRFFSRPEGLNSVAIAAVFLEGWACQRERQRQEHWDIFSNLFELKCRLVKKFDFIQRRNFLIEPAGKARRERFAGDLLSGRALLFCSLRFHVAFWAHAKVSFDSVVLFGFWKCVRDEGRREFTGRVVCVADGAVCRSENPPLSGAGV